MFKLHCIFSLIILLVVNTFAVQEFSENVPKCHRNDNECITNAVTYLARNYPNGLSSIGLPVLEPLFVPRIDMVRETEHISNLRILNVTGLLGQITKKIVRHPLEYINWKNSNLNFWGFQNTSYTVTGFENDLSTSSVVLKMMMPNFTVSADYNLRLKLLTRPTQGAGTFKFTFENFEFRFNFVPQLYEKDGKQYMRISQPLVDYTVSNVVDMNFGKMFAGDEHLSQLENAYLKKNGRVLIDLLRSESCPELAREFSNIIDPIFEKFTIDEMFLSTDE